MKIQRYGYLATIYVTKPLFGNFNLYSFGQLCIYKY